MKINKIFIVLILLFLFCNFSYAIYMINEDINLNTKAKSFYFQVDSTENEIEFKDGVAVKNITLKNNDSINYNLFDVTYEISVIDSDVFDISLDNQNFVSTSVTKTLLGNVLLNENINIYFKVRAGKTNKLIENLNIKISAKAPYVKEIIIPIKITEYRVWNYAYTGTQQSFVAPMAGSYKIETWGAQGGSYNTTYYGGKGGYSTGKLTLAENQALYVYVGGKGNSTGEHVYQAGGYNGGGSATPDTDVNTRQSSGGGATHVAYVTGLLSELVNNKDKIILVAGGGGGSAANAAVMAVYAGAGGGLNGLSGGSYYEIETIYGTGYGGTQTAGGGYDCPREHLRVSGSFGQGGNGLYAGGGGGYYGGGVGHCSAGGGSSYIAGINEGVTIDGANSMPTHDGKSTMIGNTGNGYAKITFLGY